MYGWFDIGGNASTSNKGRYANNETAYDVIPNSIQLDSGCALYFERLPNTVQTDRLTSIGGSGSPTSTGSTTATPRPRASSASSC